MATIIQRNKKYSVVYSYMDEDNKRRQRWESFKTMADAKRRKKEVEYKEQVGTFLVPRCKTLDELLKEYVELYGKGKRALSTYSSNVALIKHYISPRLGQMQLTDISTRVIERYYQVLQKTDAVPNNARKPKKKAVSAGIVRNVHKILRSAFNQAIKWELMERNPAANATVPKQDYVRRDIWTADILFKALHLCDDPRLALALNIAFCCSLRMGEMLGLTWDCVDIDPESIAAGTASVYIEKELQRVNRKILDTLEEKDVLLQFPSQMPGTKTVMVLKRPKTESSIRKVFLPKAVAEMLTTWKQTQEETIVLLGSEYRNYNLVFAGSMGLPTEANTINDGLHRLIEENHLPRVVFHSLRHSSITYKLKLNGGDIKAVQGDSGHSQVKMVTDVYSHILDDDRKNNAQLFQDAFYENKPENSMTHLPEGLTADKLNRLLANPEMAALISTLAKQV